MLLKQLPDDGRSSTTNSPQIKICVWAMIREGICPVFQHTLPYQVTYVNPYFILFCVKNVLAAFATALEHKVKPLKSKDPQVEGP